MSVLVSEPLDELYFKWLYDQVADSAIDDPSLTYWTILRELYTTNFVWVADVMHDENRIEDGKALRIEFLNSQGLSGVSSEWIEMGCSVLELMLGLARRLEYISLTDAEVHFWFWELMNNIGFAGLNDATPNFPTEDVRIVLNRLIFRNYEPNGHGGFFPLEDPDRDQRKVSLWRQLGAYVTEQEMAE